MKLLDRKPCDIVLYRSSVTTGRFTIAFDIVKVFTLLLRGFNASTFVFTKYVFCFPLVNSSLILIQLEKSDAILNKYFNAEQLRYCENGSRFGLNAPSV